jgi:hypothetical protein
MSAEKTTRAAVPPPPRQFLPNIDAPLPASNMRAEDIAPMTFNMPRDWHTRFKMTATAYGMNMKELLLESFAAWEREQKTKAK